MECDRGPVSSVLIYYAGTRFVRKRDKCLDMHEAAPDPEDSDQNEIPDCESFREESREPRRNRHYDTEVVKPVQPQAVIEHSMDNWLCHIPSLAKDGKVTKVSTQGNGRASNHDDPEPCEKADERVTKGRFQVHEVCGAVFVKRMCTVWLPTNGRPFMDLTTDNSECPSYTFYPD